MQISTLHHVIIRPNGIDAPWEIIDGHEYDPISFHTSYDEALAHGVEIARRSAFRLGLWEDGHVRTLHDFHGFDDAVEGWRSIRKRP